MENNKTVKGHIISHNHWDRDWVLTERFTQKQAKEFFLNLFRVMNREPEYRMVLDGQTALIDDFFAECTPKQKEEAEKELKKHISAKRLAVGPNYIQPDYVLISGEAHVRNLLIGHKMGNNYGNVMKVGWLVDTFGHMSQSPQLLNQFGIKGIFIARGFPIPPEEIVSEFTWSGPDGSELLAVYTMNTSRNVMNLSNMPAIAENRVDIEIEKLTPLCSTPNVPLFNGFEQDVNIDEVWPIIRKINKRNKPYELTQSNPDEFFDTIRPELKNKKIPSCSGFLYSGIYMPLLHGTLSTRMQLKMQNDTCEKLNEKWAEPLSAICWAYGDSYPADKLEDSWKRILRNDHHDDICGSCSDEVVLDMNKRYDQSKQISTAIIKEKAVHLGSQIDTSTFPKNAMPFALLNPTQYTRNDVIKIYLEVPATWKAFHVIDAKGNPVPFQIGTRKTKKKELFLQPELPGLGYASFALVPTTEKEDIKNPKAQKDTNKKPDQPLQINEDTHTVENPFLKITINANGTVDVHCKETGKTYKEAGALVDGGDMGDLYDYSYPPQEKLVSSKSFDAKVTLTEAGPLVARFRVEQTMEIPAALAANRKHRTEETVKMPIVSYIELTANSKRVDWETSFTNIARNHRVRVHFPTDVKSDFSYAGESFDVNPFTFEGELWGIDLPKRLDGLVVPGRDTVRIRSYPFHGFCDYNDGKTGVSALGKGIREYEITKDSREIALTLLRSVGWMTHLDILTRNGDVGWEIFTPMAQCFGTHTYRYSMMPHEGDWKKGGAPMENELFNEPVQTIRLGNQKGNLPAVHSFIQIEPKEELLFSSLKLSEDQTALIVRCFNPTEKVVNGTINTSLPVDSIELSNAAEEHLNTPLKHDKKGYHFKAGNREIITLRLLVKQDSKLSNVPAAKHKTIEWCTPPDAVNVIEKHLDIPIPPLVVKQDILNEKSRMKKLRAEYKEMQEKVKSLRAKLKEDPDNDDLKIEVARVNHLVHLHYRYIEEARYSILATERRYIELNEKNAAVRKKKLAENMRKIGTIRLPQLRIVGRLHEYVRQFYVSQKALRSGDSSLLQKEVTDAAMINTDADSLKSRDHKD